MRKRRLYRFAQSRQAAPPNPRQIYHEPIPSQHAVQSEFDRGVQIGLEMAMSQHGRVVAEARREALVAAQSEPYLMMARRGGFDEGFAAGMQASQRAAAPEGSRFTYADVEAARRRGFNEGRSAAPSSGIPNVDEASIRKKMVDEMLQECRVISESNPNMAPGPFVNAVRHRVKKLA